MFKGIYIVKCSPMLMSPSKFHLRFGKVVKGRKKDLIANSTVVLGVVDFCEADLPGWITLKLYVGSK